MFGELQELRERPIPILDAVREWVSAGTRVSLARDHPLYNEPLAHASMSCIHGENYYAAAQNPPYYVAAPGAIRWILLRPTVLKMLRGVNARLAPVGLELWCHDGWRPQSVQTFFHDVWVPNRLRTRYPGMSDSEIARRSDTYWSRGYPSEEAVPEDDSPPHSTGGAVDLTLRFKNGGQVLYMGSMFDDPSEISQPDWFETRDDGSLSAQEARENRRLLYWLMTEAGLANHPHEWWHYSFGDKIWALVNREDAAFYGRRHPDGRFSDKRA